MNGKINNMNDNKDTLILLKFVTGEVRYFPESFYEVRYESDENSKLSLFRLIHKPTNTVTLDCIPEHLLYIRYHMPKKED